MVTRGSAAAAFDLLINEPLHGSLFRAISSSVPGENSAEPAWRYLAIADRPIVPGVERERDGIARPGVDLLGLAIDPQSQYRIEDVVAQRSDDDALDRDARYVPLVTLLVVEAGRMVASGEKGHGPLPARRSGSAAGLEPEPLEPAVGPLAVTQ